jgi:glycosyltransferase involved in cell wall biosynthesis
MHTDPQVDVRQVSFVLPCWNEQAILGRTLGALFDAARQLDVPFEVIVADDASTDRTAEIARECGASVVRTGCRQIAGTRNAGARAARGDLLVFVDADTLVTPEVVRAAVQAVRNGAVGGGCTVKFDEPVPLYARLMLPVFTRLYRMAGLAAGCFMFCTRQAFAAVGGFDEGLYASEECSLTLALRRQGRFVLLRETVLTSGRKLRTHSGSEIFKGMVRLARRGPQSVRDRQDKDIWYGERRPDPAPGAGTDPAGGTGGAAGG